jgi:outer membrane protein
MRIRFIQVAAATLVAATMLAPAALAADLTDIGYVDQAAIGSMPAFQAANAQLAQFKSQLDAQFVSQMKSAKSDADKQRIALAFQQKFTDKQRELLGPLLARAQLAIAKASAQKNLSVVVDKRIVIFGGQDITLDVANLLQSARAIAAPNASPPPSEIGFVDQSALTTSPKLKAANDEFAKFQADQRKIYQDKYNSAKSQADKQQIAKDYNKTLAGKQDELLKPLVDETKSVTADVAKKKNLVLVIDRADVIFGGTDVTKDVQDALSK